MPTIRQNNGVKSLTIQSAVFEVCRRIRLPPHFDPLKQSWEQFGRFNDQAFFMQKAAVSNGFELFKPQRRVR